MAMKAEYWYVILGAVGFLAASHYFPVLKKLDSMDNMNTISVDSIDEIDLGALAICRQKGLM